MRERGGKGEEDDEKNFCCIAIFFSTTYAQKSSLRTDKRGGTSSSIADSAPRQCLVCSSSWQRGKVGKEGQKKAAEEAEEKSAVG